jgi:hypothetical protein
MKMMKMKMMKVGIGGYRMRGEKMWMRERGGKERMERRCKVCEWKKRR